MLVTNDHGMTNILISKADRDSLYSALCTYINTLGDAYIGRTMPHRVVNTANVARRLAVQLEKKACE